MLTQSFIEMLKQEAQVIDGKYCVDEEAIRHCFEKLTGNQLKGRSRAGLEWIMNELEGSHGFLVMGR